MWGLPANLQNRLEWHNRAQSGYGIRSSPSNVPRRSSRYERNAGYASSAQADNAFGVTSDFNLVSVESSGDGTTLPVDEYYEAADLPIMRAEYGDAFADIAQRLIARFGGHVVERRVDASR
jgi:hypothetical protein